MTVVRRVLSVGLFVALLAGGWSFAAGNTDLIALDYLAGRTEPLPLWLLLGGAWTLGVSLAGVYLGLALLKDYVEIRRLRRAIRGLENELRDYRNKPIEADLAPARLGDAPGFDRPATRSRDERSLESRASRSGTAG